MFGFNGLPMSRLMNRVAWLTHMELLICWQITIVEVQASFKNIWIKQSWKYLQKCPEISAADYHVELSRLLMTSDQDYFKKNR